MTRSAVDRRAGVAASTVARIERGDLGVQLDTLVSVAAAVGINVVVRAFPGATPKLRDTGQLTIARQLTSEAHPTLQPHLEVPAGDFGRSADLVFFSAAEILVVEIERMPADFQAQYRLAVAKRDYLASQHARPIRLVMAVEDTARNRAALRPHLELIRQQLPGGSRLILVCLRSGRSLGTDGLLWVRRTAAVGDLSVDS
jgi:transcriptional regulator with XRE-family HTH domain